jgi:hypothetical protein
MDKTQIATHALNAVVTIVTTIIVTRVTLQGGSLGLSQRLAKRVKNSLFLYADFIFSIFWVVITVTQLFNLIRRPESLTRLDAFFIAFFTTMFWYWALRVKKEWVWAQEVKAERSSINNL